MTIRQPVRQWMTAAWLRQQEAWPRWVESSWSSVRRSRVTLPKSMPCTGQLTPGEDCWCKDGWWWGHNFLKLQKNEAKLFQICALPGHVICRQTLYTGYSIVFLPVYQQFLAISDQHLSVSGKNKWPFPVQNTPTSSLSHNHFRCGRQKRQIKTVW